MSITFNNIGLKRLRNKNNSIITNIPSVILSSGETINVQDIIVSGSTEHINKCWIDPLTGNVYFNDSSSLYVPRAHAEGLQTLEIGRTPSTIGAIIQPERTYEFNENEGIYGTHYFNNGDVIRFVRVFFPNFAPDYFHVKYRKTHKIFFGKLKYYTWEFLPTLTTVPIKRLNNHNQVNYLKFETMEQGLIWFTCNPINTVNNIINNGHNIHWPTIT